MSTNAIPVPPPPPARRVRIVEVEEEPSLASKVMSGAAAAVASADAGAAAHALAEQSHRSLEKVEQSVAITETAPASVRMNAAKAALKHQCEMLRHQAFEMEDTEASGLPVAAAKVSDMSSRATDTVVSAAKSTGGAVVGAARATGESISCAAHGIAEKSHKGIEGAEQAAAMSDAVPSQRVARTQTNDEERRARLRASEHLVHLAQSDGIPSDMRTTTDGYPLSAVDKLRTAAQRSVIASGAAINIQGSATSPSVTTQHISVRIDIVDPFEQRAALDAAPQRFGTSPIVHKGGESDDLVRDPDQPRGRKGGSRKK